MRNWADWQRRWVWHREDRNMKNKKTRKSAGVMGATTTSKDWGFGPVPCKGGKTTNNEIGETMIHRELKDQNRK